MLVPSRVSLLSALCFVLLTTLGTGELFAGTVSPVQSTAGQHAEPCTRWFSNREVNSAASR